MPRARLTKSVIDAIPTPASELVYWDETLPGFGVKVTPAGRKVSSSSTGPLVRARAFASTPSAPMAASRCMSLETSPPNGFPWRERRGAIRLPEKREARRRLGTDNVDDLVNAFIKQHEESLAVATWMGAAKPGGLPAGGHRHDRAGEGDAFPTTPS